MTILRSRKARKMSSWGACNKNLARAKRICAPKSRNYNKENLLRKQRRSGLTHKDTHKPQALRGISRHGMTLPSGRLKHQKSFIQRSFGIIRHPRTFQQTTASLGLEPRQRDPESLVLPLHHEARARGTRPKAEFVHCASGPKSDALAINPKSLPHPRARLRPQDNFRFSRPAFAPSGPSGRSFRHHASGRGEKALTYEQQHR